MNILVVNAGSSSIKFTLTRTDPARIEANTDEHRAKGQIERIGTSEAEVHFEHRGTERHETCEVANYHEGLDRVLSLLQGEGGPLSDPGEIDAVGHRVVHGGESFSDPVRIDEEVEREIADCARFAPLHNPHNLKGIRATREAFPNVSQVACFDTGVHQSLPEKSYLYALPRELYEEHGIRRYGFHGLSHRYMRMRAGRFVNRPAPETTLISCHLGNGCSVAAFDGKKVVDTSMGFTPLEGLVMGTRCGDLDPAIPLYLMEHEGVGPDELNTLLNNESGLLGLSGVTGDMESLLERTRNGDEQCEQAVEVFCHRLQKYIGSYYGLLNGADVILFTGGIGVHAPEVRRRSTAAMDNLGIVLDDERNSETAGEEGRISPDGASTVLGVVPTDEERMIARDTVRCLSS